MCMALLIDVGCAERRPTRPERPESTSADATMQTTSEHPQADGNDVAPNASTPSRSVELSEANWSELQSLIAEHKGKVVVVDLWSTACEPCMKEFPHLIELAAHYPNDVQAISFDLDFAGIKNKPVSYYRERVLKFLNSQPENKILHRMCSKAADELFEEIQLNSIPAVYVFDRQGILAKRFIGSEGQDEGVSYVNQITPFVRQLLQSPGNQR